MFVIRHRNGLYLKLCYVSTQHRRSIVELVDNGFPCFKSEELARQYIEDGKELFYSYEDCGIHIEHLSIIPLYGR